MVPAWLAPAPMKRSAECVVMSGTEVRITIGRPGVADPLEFTIIREVIQIKSIPYFFKLDNGVGYIRISQFNENTASELRTALGTLESQNIRGLIIDLRWNPGGLLDQASRYGE
jgi:carboxyl-terminal processing protease